MHMHIIDSDSPFEGEYFFMAEFCFGVFIVN